MQDYAVIIPLWTKILVKNAESPEKAIEYAKGSVATNISHVRIDDSEEIEVFSPCGEKGFHLTSRP